MENFIIALIFILIIIVCLGIKYIIAYTKEMKTKKLVLWVTSEDRQSLNSRPVPLYVYLNDARAECELPEEYAIKTDDEKEYAKIIFESFKQFLIDKHLKNNLSLIKSKYFIPDEIQFFYLLATYLYNHESDNEFSGYKIRSNVISEKKYDTGGCETVFNLSEFGAVYFKIQYLALNGYLKCDLFQKYDLVLKCHSNAVKNILSTNSIELLFP